MFDQSSWEKTLTLLPKICKMTWWKEEKHFNAEYKKNTE